MNTRFLEGISSVILFGYGAEGQAAEEFFSTSFPHISLTIYDENQEKFSTIPQWENFDAIIPSPGISPEKYPKNFSGKILSPTQIFFGLLPEQKRKNVIGITGSKGKSTLCAFLAECFSFCSESCFLGGNFGTPLLSLLNNFLDQEGSYVIAELSSFQLFGLQNSPGVSAFVSFFPEHLEWHKTEKQYLSAKKNIFLHQKETDSFFLPKTFPPEIQSEFLSFGGKNTKIVQEQKNYTKFKNPNFNHPLYQASFGLALAILQTIFDTEKALGVFEKAAESFAGLPHRMELVAEKNDVLFVNDSIATTPDASLFSAQISEENLGVIILGGVGESHYSFEKLFKKLVQSGVEIVVLKSPLQEKIKEAARTCKAAITLAKDLAEAVQTADKICPKGRSVLFSPGGKSFYAYNNYKQRGDSFREIVLGTLGGNGKCLGGTC